MRSFSLLIILLAATGCGSDSKPNLERDDGYNAMMARDDDGDGFAATDDCDDADANINPGATEICDEVDNDCDCDDTDDNGDGVFCGVGDYGVDDLDNSVVENWWAPDRDADMFTIESGIVATCEITSLEEFATEIGGDPNQLSDWAQVTQYDSSGQPRWDCDDEEAAIYPGAAEVCDDMVNDCDSTSETPDDGLDVNDYYMDMDGDSHGDASMSMSDCAASDGYVEDNTDCDDGDAAVNPGATEVCDEFDTDEDCDTYADDDDVEGASGMTTWYPDMDGDGAGGDDYASVDACEQSSGYYAENNDCDDADGSVIVETTWYYDGDGDGEGDESIDTTPSCHAPTGYVDNYGDCDDANAAVNTDAVEVVNGIDDNCRDGIDEGVSCTVEINLFTDDAGTASWIDGTVSDNVDLDGDWSVSDAASPWSTSVTNLGGDDWFYSIQFDHCLDSGTVITLEAMFADGSSFADSGTVYAWEDATLLSISGSGGTLSITE